jgi:flagellin
MAMVVKNNMSAVNTLNTLNKNSAALSKSLQKVSSGMVINSAADDASGYAISERMRVQVQSLDQDNKNAQNGNSMMKVAEGAVSSTVDILKTLKKKVINAANDTNTDADRQTIQKELDQSIDQIDDNANVTYNGKYLVDGSHNNKIKDGGVATRLTNESMQETTKGTSKLTQLNNRSGESLYIHSDDQVTVSYVKQGKTYTTTFKVGTTTLAGILAKTALNGTETLVGSDALSLTGSQALIGKDGSGTSIYTADNANAITFTAKASGTDGQIAGFTISITDKTGKINKNANAIWITSTSRFARRTSPKTTRLSSRLARRLTRPSRSVSRICALLLLASRARMVRR